MRPQSSGAASTGRANQLERVGHRLLARHAEGPGIVDQAELVDRVERREAVAQGRLLLAGVERSKVAALAGVDDDGAATWDDQPCLAVLDQDARRRLARGAGDHRNAPAQRNFPRPIGGELALRQVQRRRAAGAPRRSTRTSGCRAGA
jgi:hypothetical protein